MRRSTGEVAIRIVEAARQLGHTQPASERRRRRADEQVGRALEVVAEAVRGAHRRPAVAGHIPRHPDARRNVGPLVVQPRLAGRKIGVAGIQESRRRVAKDRARGALAEPVETEVGNRLVLDARAEERLPPDPTVQRHAPADAPRVLGVQAEVVLLHVEDTGPRVLETGQPSREEVRHADPGERSVKGPETDAALTVDRVVLPVRHVAAQRELMAASHHREVVGDLIRVGIALEEHRPARRCREAAADLQPDHARYVVVEVSDAERLGAEERLEVVVRAAAVPPPANRIHHIGAEDAGIAERQRMRAMVLRGVLRPRGQHVAGRGPRRELLVERQHVAAEHRMPTAPLIVDLGDDLVLVVVQGRGKPDVAARIGRRRQLSRDRHCRRAEEARIDLVAHKRGAQRDLLAPVAGRRGERRKVAGQHRGRRNARDRVGRRDTEERPLIGAEEEQAVRQDRPAEHAAWLIPLEAVVQALAVGTDGRKDGLGVEPLVAQELEERAMQHIRARLRHRVHRAAGMDAVVGGEPARRDAEFLQRVGKRQRHVQVVVRVVVHGAVEQVRHTEWQAPGHPGKDRPGHALVVGHVLHCGARQHDQVRDLTAL